MLSLQVREQLEAARAAEADLRGQVHSSRGEVQSQTQQLQASRLAAAELEVQLAASREQGQAKSGSIQGLKEQQQQVGTGGGLTAVHAVLPLLAACADNLSPAMQHSCLPSCSTHWD